MRSGRPCPCDCVETCQGFSCDNFYLTDCQTINEYGNFSEPFNDPLQVGWQRQSFVSNNGKGALPSGTTNDYDYVIGEPISNSGGCRLDSLGCTFYDLDPTQSGYANFGFYGSHAPVVTTSNAQSSLTLPNGSGLTIDTNFESGDRYIIKMLTYNKPDSNSVFQEVDVYKRRNSTGFRCSTFGSNPKSRSGAGYVYELPNSGCPYYECLIFSETYEKTPASGDIYILSSPIQVGAEISGAQYQLDDFCWYSYTDVSNKTMLGSFGCQCSDSTNEYLFPKTKFRLSNYYCDPEPSSICSGPEQTGYLIFSAYHNEYLKYAANEDDEVWRCDIGVVPPTSSNLVYLRCPIDTYEVDLLADDTWSITPVVTEQYVSEVSKIVGIDPETGLNVYENFVNFSGYPCHECLPLLSFDNPRYAYGDYRHSLEDAIPNNGISKLGLTQNNVVVDSGACPRVGTLGLNAFGMNDKSLSIKDYEYLQLSHFSENTETPIVRGDDFSLFKFYRGASYVGTQYHFDENCQGEKLFEVEKLSYKLNWDPTNLWWSGNFRFLSSSGTPNSGLLPICTGSTYILGTGDDYELKHMNSGFHNVYHGSECELGTITISRPCSEYYASTIDDGTYNIRNQTVTIKFDEQVYSHETFYRGRVGSWATSDSNRTMIDAMDREAVQADSAILWGPILDDDGNSSTPPPMLIQDYPYYITEWTADYPVLTDPSGCGSMNSCPQISGSFHQRFYGYTSFNLNVGEDYSRPVLPGVFMDEMGNIIVRRSPEFVNSFNTSRRVPYWGFGTIVPETAWPYSSYNCVTSLTDMITYEQQSTGVFEIYNGLHKELHDLTAYCCAGKTNLSLAIYNFPFWVGTVHCRVHFASWDGDDTDNFTPIDDANPRFGVGDAQISKFSSGRPNQTLFEGVNVMVGNLIVFLDKTSGEFKALLEPYKGSFELVGNNDIITLDGRNYPRDYSRNLPCPKFYESFDDCVIGAGTRKWWESPRGFIKSQADITSGSYFANVTVLNTSPLKLKIEQPFMAWGIWDLCDEYNSNEDIKCKMRKLYGYLAVTTIEEPVQI